MSDQARNYVKQLPRSRATAAQKKFLFFVADYHNLKAGCAWPGLQTLAEDMNITTRQVRNLLTQCEERGLIEWTPGLGSGNLGRFVFVDLRAAKEEQKEEQKEERKEEIPYPAIRKEPGTLNPEPKTEDQHAWGALGAEHDTIRKWIAFKDNIRHEIGEEEWIDWLRPVYFLKMLDHNHVLLAAPPNNGVIKGYKKREGWIRTRMLKEMGTTCSLTKYPEPCELEILSRTSPEWAEVANRLNRKKDSARVTA